MSEGLTQDDFRRLMATPRRPAEGEENSQQPKFKIPAPKTPRAGGAVFAQPRAVRKKHFKKKPEEGGEEEQQEEKEKPNYRDRAAERRQQEQQGTNDDTADDVAADPEVDHKQLYEQSKLLGGDVDKTHLVKGLDFELLKKVRSDLLKKKQEQENQQDEDEAMDDADLDQVFEKFERGEKIADEEVAPEEQPKQFHSLMAKNIFELIEQQDNPPRNELFESGRMAYVFELADEVGHYSDAFAIPTAIVRSKTDIAAKLTRSGLSEDTETESKLVLEKISRVMSSVRSGERQRQEQPKLEAKKKTVAVTSEPIAMVEDGFMGDIFADAGRDYELDENTLSAAATTKSENKGSYFTGLIDEKEEDVEMQDTNNEAVNALLSKATGEKEGSSKKRKYNQQEMDADAADIDMFGLSSSALPTSFTEHEAYQSNDEEEEDKNITQMMDQGTSRNKKAQLTRWDFETEEEWQKYKDTIEIHPKSAFQFGVKLGDGRKRHRERKGMNEKQRLNRDYQQVKNIMSKKYGKSLDN